VRRAIYAPPPARLLYLQGGVLTDGSVRELDGGDGNVPIVAIDEASGTTVCVASAWQVRLYKLLGYPDWCEPTMRLYYAWPEHPREPRWVEMRLDEPGRSGD
jgi:hypothetical protein